MLRLFGRHEKTQAEVGPIQTCFPFSGKDKFQKPNSSAKKVKSTEKIKKKLKAVKLPVKIIPLNWVNDEFPDPSSSSSDEEIEDNAKPIKKKAISKDVHPRESDESNIDSEDDKQSNVSSDQSNSEDEDEDKVKLTNVHVEESNSTQETEDNESESVKKPESNANENHSSNDMSDVDQLSKSDNENAADAAGDPSNAAGNQSDAAGNQSDAADNQSDVVGNPSDAAGYPSDAAGDQSDVAGTQSDVVGTQSDVDGNHSDADDEMDTKESESANEETKPNNKSENEEKPSKLSDEINTEQKHEKIVDDGKSSLTMSQMMKQIFVDSASNSLDEKSNPSVGNSKSNSVSDLQDNQLGTGKGPVNMSGEEDVFSEDAKQSAKRNQAKSHDIESDDGRSSEDELIQKPKKSPAPKKKRQKHEVKKCHVALVKLKPLRRGNKFMVTEKSMKKLRKRERRIRKSPKHTITLEKVPLSVLGRKRGRKPGSASTPGPKRKKQMDTDDDDSGGESQDEKMTKKKKVPTATLR